jgi:hypothetical protein
MDILSKELVTPTPKPLIHFHFSRISYWGCKNRETIIPAKFFLENYLY